MSRPHALDLPEILALISQHLTPKDLYACIQVSHSFYLAFVPPLWSTIVIQPPQKTKDVLRIPSKQALTRHHHLIQKLRLFNVFPPHYITAFQDTLKELHINTLSYRRYDPPSHLETLRQLMGTIGMNASSLRDLSVMAIVPRGSVGMTTKMWEVIRSCRQVTTLEVAHLAVTTNELEAFWEICGGDTEALIHATTVPRVVDRGHCDGPATSTQPPLTSSRSVKLGVCPINEWPDKLYEDESLTLPAITSIEFTASVQEPARMSAYGQAKLMRKCINLKRFLWTGGDSRLDNARAERLNLKGASDVEWFFGGLLGDTPSLQGQYGWKHVDEDDDETEEREGRLSEKWPLPHLESIETSSKRVSDFDIARLLKRLHRLTTFRLRSPCFGPLAFQELVQERVPLRAMPTCQPQDPSSLLSTSSRLLSPLPSRRLCMTIKVLDVASYTLLSSENILELLESCPVLEDFRARVVNMSEVLKRPDWVCNKIKILTFGMFFDNPTPAINTASAPTAASSVNTLTSAAAAITLTSPPGPLTPPRGIFSNSTCTLSSPTCTLSSPTCTLSSPTCTLSSPTCTLSSPTCTLSSPTGTFFSSTATSTILFGGIAPPTTPTSTTSPLDVTKEAHRAVFTQLARLQNIKIFISSYYDTPRDTIELQLKLDYGLDSLSTWGESIEHLRCGYQVPQNMTIDDVRWMLDHWPNLKSMDCSSYHPDKTVDRQIRALLKSRGVSLNYYQPF